MLTFIFSGLASVGDALRRKIENQDIILLSAFGEKLACAYGISIFYQNRFYIEAWNQKLANELVELLKSASEDGLNPTDYHLNTIINQLGKPLKTETALADFDLILTDAFLLFSSHLMSGKVNPETIDPEWHVNRREGDPVSLLNKALELNNIRQTITNIKPTNSTYLLLAAALKKYENKTPDTSQLIPEGITIKLNNEDLRLPAIKEKLALLDYKISNSNSIQYDEITQQAIIQFQQNHGLENDGNIGTKTIKALNNSISDRVALIKANMERLRWLPSDFGKYYIVVNIPAYELTLIKNNNLISLHKVIAGKSFRRTPVLNSTINYLVFNPTWTIPPGILKADILPAVQKDNTYLIKKNITVFDGTGNIINQETIDWKSSAAKTYTYQQAPGPNNSLGAVKFIFANNFNVYLHDTPNKELFAQTERSFSSGCIRVDQPLKLAEHLINDNINWNMAKIKSVVETKQTQTVILKEPPSVYLIYLTAWVNTEGVLQFRNDIYNRDSKLIEALNQTPYFFNN